MKIFLQNLTLTKIWSDFMQLTAFNSSETVQFYVMIIIDYQKCKQNWKIIMNE